MRYLYYIIFFFLSTQWVTAQEIVVLDKNSGDPLVNVAIFNADKSRAIATDIDGKADIARFRLEELLIFRHMTHKELHISKKDILANNNQVFLKPDENQLEQIVLSAGKFEMQTEEIPQKIIGLSRNDVQLSAPQTSADLLESSGQVFVQKSQLGGGSPMIRGFSTNRLLITVDGVRMNTAIFRSGNIQNIISVDPLLVARTEVILGPGSVVYGSDAVGGVMNFHTLKPSFKKAETNFSGVAYSRYATANNEKTLHADVNYGTDKWAFITGITLSDFEDLRMGSYGPDDYLREEYVVQEKGVDVLKENEDPRLQKFTGYNQMNFLQKVRFMPHDDWDLNLGLIYSETSDFPRYDRLTQKREGDFRYAEWYYGPQKWFLGNFKISKTGHGPLYDKAKLTAAYQFFEESRNNRNFNEPQLYSGTENVDAYSLNLDFEKDFEESRFFYGGEYVFNLVNSTASVSDITSEEVQPDGSRYPDGSTWQSLAAYASYQWKIATDLSFQSGLRYNRIFSNADFRTSGYDFPFEETQINTGALTGSAGINWKQNRFFRWKLNLSTAFRAPNIDDIGKVFDSEPGAVVVPNPDLNPEYAYNAELGVNWMPSRNLRFSTTGYYSLLEDAMVRRDYNLNGETEIEYQGEPSRVQAVQNAAKARVYGIEAGLEYDILVALRFSSRFNITKGVEENDGEISPLRHAAPTFGNAHLTWHKNQVKLDLFAEYNGEFNYEDLAISERGKPHLYALDQNGNPYAPSWYTINLTGQYEFNESWLATISLENITDQRYRTYSSGIAAAGRNLILSLRFEF